MLISPNVNVIIFLLHTYLWLAENTRDFSHENFKGVHMMDNEKEEIMEMNMVYQNPINDNKFLLGNAQLKIVFEDNCTKNELKHILKVFVVGESANILERVYDKSSDFTKLLKWCREGKSSLYDQIFYIPDMEERKKLMDFILDFLNINSSCFQSMNYDDNKVDLIKIIQESD